MSGFPWNSLIIVVGPLAGALGGVLITGRQEAAREERRAERSRRDAREERCRGAYADLVTAARFMLRNQRQLGLALTTGSDTEHPIIQGVIARGNELLNEMNRTVVVVALVGSNPARTHANTVFEAVKTGSDIITTRLSDVHARRSGKTSSVSSFPAADIVAALDRLDAAIEAFIDAVSPELSPDASPNEQRAGQGQTPTTVTVDHGQ